jgi:ABC-type phosphate transport system substrate-binding protein
MAASSKSGSDGGIYAASYPEPSTVVNDPEAFAIGQDSVALMVPSTNTWISQITCQQIDQIYTGVYTNWQQIPGLTGAPNQAITVIGRETSSGTFDGFNNFFLTQWGHSASNLVAGYIGETTNQQVLADIQGGSNPYAIAFIGLGFVDQAPTGVKPLNLYNPTTGLYTVPTIAHVKDGTYVASGGTFTSPKVIYRWLWYFMDGIPTAGTANAVKSVWVSYVKSNNNFVSDNGYILMNRADMAGATANNPSTTVGTQTVPDGKVNYNDVTYFVSAYILYNGAQNKLNPYADFNADSQVSYSDVTAFVSAYIAYNS